MNRLRLGTGSKLYLLACIGIHVVYAALFEGSLMGAAAFLFVSAFVVLLLPLAAGWVGYLASGLRHGPGRVVFCVALTFSLLLLAARPPSPSSSAGLGAEAMAAADDLRRLTREATAVSDEDEVATNSTARAAAVERYHAAIRRAADSSAGMRGKILRDYDRLLSAHLRKVDEVTSTLHALLAALQSDIHLLDEAGELDRRRGVAAQHAQSSRAARDSAADLLDRLVAQLGTSHPLAADIVAAERTESGPKMPLLVELFEAHEAYATAAGALFDVLHDAQGSWLAEDQDLLFELQADLDRWRAANARCEAAFARIRQVEARYRQT